MAISDMLAQAGGLESIARDLGIGEEDARTGADALLPAILGGFQKQAQSVGIDGVGGMLSQLGGSDLLDQVLAPQRTDPAAGDEVLGQIFGSREVSRTVAGSASAQTGLDPALLKKMLPLLAMLVSGFMAKGGSAATASSDSGGLGGILGGVLGNVLGGSRAQAGGLGGLAGLLDANGDGNALDDILRMMGNQKR